jgi:hypothetical protein
MKRLGTSKSVNVVVDASGSAGLGLELSRV